MFRVCRSERQPLPRGGHNEDTRFALRSAVLHNDASEELFGVLSFAKGFLQGVLEAVVSITGNAEENRPVRAHRIESSSAPTLHDCPSNARWNIGTGQCSPVVCCSDETEEQECTLAQ